MGELLLVLHGSAAPGEGGDFRAIVWRADAPEFQQASLLHALGNAEELELGGGEGSRVDSVDAQDILGQHGVALGRLGRTTLRLTL